MDIAINKGDPVCSAHNPNIIGKVTFITSNGLVFMRRIGNRHIEEIFTEKELVVCKCATRIPKGVSKCQK